MIGMIKDLDLAKYKHLFAAGAESSLRAQMNRRRGAAMVMGNLVRNDRTDISGVGARVYKNGVYGFSSQADLTEEAIRSVLTAATDNAIFMDKHIGKGKGNLPLQPAGNFTEDRLWRELPQKAYVDAIREVDAYIKEKYPKLMSRSVIATADCMEKLHIGSDGMSAYSVLPRAYIYVGMTAEDSEGSPIELMDIFGGRGMFDEYFSDPSTMFERLDRLYERLMQKKEGVYAEAGIKTCILGGILSGMLSHEAVGHTVEADLVLGGSVAAHNLGKEVASPLVSMTDFAHHAFGKEMPLPVYVDDEGVLAKDAPLIKDGILVGYMNNRETAERFGMEACGNARAYKFSDEPLIRMRNTAIHPGESKLADMIASVEDGYYLIDTNNGQADTTGEFMFGVTMGYEIKNGKLGRAIKDTTISGVAFEMLKTVDMVSDEMTWSSSGFCGKKQPMPVGMGGPALRCKIMIGGR